MLPTPKSQAFLRARSFALVLSRQTLCPGAPRTRTCKLACLLRAVPEGLGLSPGATGNRRRVLSWCNGWSPGLGSGALSLCSAPGSSHFPMRPMSLPCQGFGTLHMTDAQEIAKSFELRLGEYQLAGSGMARSHILSFYKWKLKPREGSDFPKVLQLIRGQEESGIPDFQAMPFPCHFVSACVQVPIRHVCHVWCICVARELHRHSCMWIA